MAKLGGILFFVDILVGFYLINMGFTPNFVNLSFLDPIKNWVFIGGGILLIIGGLMSAMKRTQQR